MLTSPFGLATGGVNMSSLLVLGSTPNINLIVIASVEIFHLIVCSGRFACQAYSSHFKFCYLL